MRKGRQNSTGPAAARPTGLGVAAPALELHDIRKVYGTGETAVTALHGLTLTLAQGSFTAVMGPSGSGKSTFLQSAAGLDRPTSGRVFIAGAELPTAPDASEAEVTRFRRGRVGFVFQQYNLLPTLTVLQNVALPARLAGRRVSRHRVETVLTRVGLGDRLHHRPAELSGGQQQRVAVARALVSQPGILFADEPTGALDARSGREVLTLLREAVQADGQTVVMVTHDPVAAAYADSVLFLADGRLVGRLERPTAEAVAAWLGRLGTEEDVVPPAASAVSRPGPDRGVSVAARVARNGA